MPAALRHVHHLGDVGGIRLENFWIVWLGQTVPNVVDADADRHEGRLLVHHIVLEAGEQIFGLLTADAGVHDFWNFQIRSIARPGWCRCR